MKPHMFKASNETCCKDNLDRTTVSGFVSPSHELFKVVMYTHYVNETEWILLLTIWLSVILHVDALQIIIFGPLLCNLIDFLSYFTLSTTIFSFFHMIV